MTVWVVNADKHDTSSAAVWGDIRYVNARYVYGDEIERERMPPMFEEGLRRAAVEFDPYTDFVLICGDHLQLVAFMSYIAQAHASAIRVLRFDKKVQGYIPVRV